MRQFSYLITSALLASEAFSAGIALPSHFIYMRNESSPLCSQLDPRAEEKERSILGGGVPISASSQGVSPQLLIAFVGAFQSVLRVVDASSLSHVAFFWLENGYPVRYRSEHATGSEYTRAAPSHRTCCADKDILYLLCPTWQALAQCGCLHLKCGWCNKFKNPNKKFVRVFPYCLTEKPEQNLWPTQ